MGTKQTLNQEEISEKDVAEIENLIEDQKSETKSDKSAVKSKSSKKDKNKSQKEKSSGKIKSETAKLDKLKKEIQDKDEQLKESKDRYLRLSAEFDNFRKRTLKEKMDLTKYAGEDLLKDLLPVFDDFDRGMGNINKGVDIEAIKQGMELIQNKFNNFISQKGLKEIDAINQVFNIDMHEAITKIPAPEEKLKGKIVDVIEKGYYLNDKVVRFAKVVIGE